MLDHVPVFACRQSGCCHHLQCSRKGEFSRAAVRGKQGIELGAGPGLAGMAFCLLGGSVLLTDLPDILPLLSKNVDANLSPAALKGWCTWTTVRELSDESSAHDTATCLSSVLKPSNAVQGREGMWDAGAVRLQALDWNSPSDIQAAGGPFQYVLAADCVYHENHVEPLYRVILALTNAKSAGAPTASIHCTPHGCLLSLHEVFTRVS